MKSLGYRIEISLGPARLGLSPREAWVWQEAALAAPGPASLCLGLLALSRPRWQGVTAIGQPDPSPTPANLARLPAAVLEALLPALCPPWLTPREEAELLALERYLLALADFPGLDCAACREQEARGEGGPACAACPRPWPPASARVALALHPLLAALPGGGAATWLQGLSPRQQRLLAMRLALIERLRRRPNLPVPEPAC
jgi:hypothetical protein